LQTPADALLSSQASLQQSASIGADAAALHEETPKIEEKGDEESTMFAKDSDRKLRKRTSNRRAATTTIQTQKTKKSQGKARSKTNKAAKHHHSYYDAAADDHDDDDAVDETYRFRGKHCSGATTAARRASPRGLARSTRSAVAKVRAQTPTQLPARG
jgi:hypothetical protein